MGKIIGIDLGTTNKLKTNKKYNYGKDYWN